MNCFLAISSFIIKNLINSQFFTQLHNHVHHFLSDYVYNRKQVKGEETEAHTTKWTLVL